MFMSKLLSNAIKNVLGLELEKITRGNTFGGAVREYNREPRLRPALSHPFFTDAVEADEFYYPKHLRGFTQHRIASDESPYTKHMGSLMPMTHATRVLPKDAVPIEEMDYKSIPFVIRLNKDVQTRTHAEHVKVGDKMYLQYINRDSR